jgi:CheY-like chemotaxis protein
MDSNTVGIKSILLVEDDPRDVELTLAGLAEHNLANKVVVVRDGEEALDYLYHRGSFKTRAGGNPVVVLLDIKMPKVTGLEVLKIIKADEQLKNIPVVMLTSSRETPDLAECYKRGVNAYVVKPVDFEDFMKAIRELGLFWAAVNEPPPDTWKKEITVQPNDEMVIERKDVA